MEIMRIFCIKVEFFEWKLIRSSEVIRMGKNLLRLSFIVVACSVIIVNCDEKISVVGPAVLRTDEPYKFAVTNHNLIAQDKVISVSIEGTSFSGERYNVTKEVSVAPGQTTIDELEVKLNFSRKKRHFKFS